MPNASRGAAVTLYADGQEQTSVLSILALLLRERRTLMVAMVLSLATALAIVLFKTRTYTSSFSFVPQAAQDPSRAGLASIAGQLGVSIGGAAGGAQSPQLYADLLRTREMLEPIVVDSFALASGGRRVPLSEFLKVRDERPAVVVERTITALRPRIAANVALRTTGMVSVSVTTADPSVSLGIAERLFRGLSEFNLKTRRSQAGEERRFTETRLLEARRILRLAEDALQTFQSSNRQYANSPQLEFQRSRLEREVSQKQQLVSGLVQSYEEARIREVRDTPVISVVDHPARAALPDPRGGLVIMCAGAALGLLLGILAAVTKDTIRRIRASQHDPDVSRLATEWRTVVGDSRG